MVQLSTYLTSLRRKDGGGYSAQQTVVVVIHTNLIILTKCVKLDAWGRKLVVRIGNTFLPMQ